MKITKEDVNNWKKFKNELNTIDSKITDRMDEIITIIFESFDYDREKSGVTWSFWGAEEGDEGELPLNEFINLGEISYCLDYEDYAPIKLIEYDYNSGFPIEFLYMNDCDIKKNIKNVVDTLENKKKVAAEKRKNKDSKKKELIAKAKSKLTPSERKILGI